MPAPTSVMSPVSLTSYFDPATGQVKAASLYFYRANTLDPITVYTDALLSVPHPQPVLSTGFGRIPAVWVGHLADPGYRVRAFDQWSALIEDIDNIPGSLFGGDDEGEGPILDGDPRLIATGDIIPSFNNSQPRLGFVLCNGTSIGPEDSAFATQRANADTEALFKFLWACDQYGTLTMYPDRGTTAQGDWDSSKAIQVPNLQGRLLVGVDQMGTEATHLLDPITFDKGSTIAVGGYGGTVNAQLLAENIPAHNHNLTQTPHQHYSVFPAHGHPGSYGTSDYQGSHTHTGSTDTEPAHSHRMLGVHFGSNGFGGGGVDNGAYYDTDPAGAHSHKLTINANGSHAHNIGVVIATAPAIGVWDDLRNANITIDSFGGDQPFKVMPPFLQVSFYMKL